MNKKSRAIFLTVRTGSTRLPGKALLNIGGRAAVEQLIRRLKYSELADMIVLCTTEEKADDKLCNIAEESNINFFRGSTKDKLNRWLGATRKFNVDFFVTADGDDIFCEPELIDLAFKQYKRSFPDFIEGRGLICGAFTYGIKTSALKKVCEIKDTDDTEMMYVYFTETGLFRVEELENVPDLFRRPEIRMTLDYYDDLKFFRKISQHFLQSGQDFFNLRDIITFLDKNPKVIKINQYLQQRYLDNQKNKTKLVIKKMRPKCLKN